MSGRSKSTPLKRRRRVRLSTEEIHNCAFSLLMAKALKSKLISTPQKRTKGTRRAASNIQPAEVISLDNTPEVIDITNTVEAKVNNFIESGSFLSSDDDEVEELKLSQKKIEETCSKSINSCEASTSGISWSNKPNVDDDVMELVDSVLEKTKDVTPNTLTDIRSLEDFRKETEEMLQNASKLLDEIKTDKKVESVKKVEPETNEESEKAAVASCPICMESLADRSASVTMCGHIFCTDCLKQAAKSLKKCPTCRKAINTKKIHPIYL